MSSTQSVLDHHLEMFGEGDLDGLMSDYADDAVFISADGTLEGRDEVRAMFADLLAEFDDPSVSFSLDEQVVRDEYAYIVWHAETPENVYEFASDTFEIRDGEIVAQTLAADVSPKD
ncbi:nuclear transport factor 2 family protein [Haloarcula onubensis]|uniref:Nuclear transport factor 2 family protein n=1 Tax=Haloarcula onubensis TaxID=2950539 RepID=A0ABU2FLD6_9EURY|nr:nuclear transport factor 2 family protein [Halomicroarcula sp. S3CR25-11]MDS0281062.1 nuclear transport factor 2 family protein [Halomicroarcula sp. S3CR25-11]